MKKVNKKCAVAILYDKEIHNAPIVISKGRDIMALRIMEIARKHNIPIVEDGETFFDFMKLNIGEEIPYSLYEATSVILSSIYKLKVNKNV